MYNTTMSTSFNFKAAASLFLCLVLFLHTAEATSLDREALRIQDQYTSISSLKFAFEQQTINAGRMRQGMGDGILLHKPEKSDDTGKSTVTIMRWNYRYPSKQIILNTGKEISIYTEEDKQLIITAAEDMQSDITFALFSGTIQILDAFSVTPGKAGLSEGDNKQLLSSIILTPRENHPQLQKLHLWYGPDYLIHKLAMEDHFGAVTTITLKDMHVDTIKVDDAGEIADVLALDVPGDTEIIRQ